MRTTLLLVLVAAPAWAQDAPPRLTIRNHLFDPAELHVPADQPVTIDVHNEDPTAEEFDSSALGVEKVIAGGRQAPVRLRPLAPGRYPFIGEYHSDTARGVIVADGKE